MAERIVPLDEVRADGWFERLGAGSAAFAQLCQIVGDRFVAFSIVAGLRITALQVDSRNPDRSTIEFGVGEGGAAQRMSLGDFRRRLANALIAEEDPTLGLSAQPSPEELQAFIGVRNVLLAPILGLGLDALILSDERVAVRGSVDGVPTEIELHELRRLVRDRIRHEADRYRTPTPFSIDLSLVPEAEEAARQGDAARVVALLGSWPGPLSMLLRSAEGQSMSDEARGDVARALGMLGTAYVALERSDWAEEVLRLGIQWAGDGPAAGDLFRRMGDAYLAGGRTGESIGLFRRALALGAAPRDVLPSLARAFVERQRYLGALVCADDAVAAGASPDSVAELRARAREALGETWSRFRAHVDEPAS